MKKHLLFLICINLVTSLVAQENVIINNPANPVTYTVTYSGYYSGSNNPVVQSRDVGMNGGLTYHYSSVTWPYAQSYWGMNIADGASISTEGPLGFEYTHPGTKLTYSSGSSNLTGGVAVFNGYTLFGYLNTIGNTVYTNQSTRFIITITDISSTPVPILTDGSTFYVPSSSLSSFNVNVRMEMIAPSGMNFGGITSGIYYPVIYLFDQMHTLISGNYSVVYTSFTHNFYSQSNVWFGYNTNWSDMNNWTDDTRLPKSTDIVMIPSIPIGGNMPTLGDGGTHSVLSLSIDPSAILTLNTSILNIGTTGAK